MRARKQFGLLVVACGLAALALPASACTTPVYQYALERWPADPYVVTVWCHEPLSEAELAALEQLTKAASDEAAAANLQVKTVDLAQGSPLPIPSMALPWMVASYPERNAGLAPVLSCPLGAAQVEAVLDSPARREIARRLLAGHAAVWVFVECGDKAKDARALKVLAAELQKHNKELRQRIAQALGQDPASCQSASFSILRVLRSDAAEQVLVNMLLKSEADLEKISGEPMAFPIFGRGRILYAMAGRGINEDVIAEACSFLASPCACEIKEDNPGVDLLMAVDWDKALEAEGRAEALLPLLAGAFPDEAQPEPAAPAPVAPRAGKPRGRIAVTPAGEPARAPGGAIARNALIALAAVAVAGLVLALIMRSRHRSLDV